MRYIYILSILFIVSSISPAFSDEIVLTNGDRLSGTLKTSDGTSVILETEYSDPIKISKSKIKRIYVNNPADIHLITGEVLRGSIRSEGDGKIIVDGSPGRQPVSVEWDNVAALNPPPEHLSKWTGNITVGAGMQSGNTDRASVSVGAEATRRSVNDRFSMRLLYNYAEEDKSVSTRNTYGAMKYDYFFTEKYYVYLSTELLHDSFKNLNLRTVIGPGVGYQVWDDTIKFLLFEAGLSYYSEDLKEGVDQDWITGRVAGNVRYTVLDTLVLSDYLLIYPSFEDAGEFTLRNEASITSPLAAGWSLKFSNILEHDSDPPAGIQSNDWQWLLGLQYGF